MLAYQWYVTAYCAYLTSFDGEAMRVWSQPEEDMQGSIQSLQHSLAEMEQQRTEQQEQHKKQKLEATKLQTEVSVFPL